MVTMRTTRVPGRHAWSNSATRKSGGGCHGLCVRLVACSMMSGTTVVAKLTVVSVLVVPCRRVPMFIATIRCDLGCNLSSRQTGVGLHLPGGILKAVTGIVGHHMSGSSVHPVVFRNMSRIMRLRTLRPLAVNVTKGVFL